MQRWKELTIAGLTCALIFGVLTQLVAARRPAQLRAEDKAMAQRVEQIHVRVQLIVDDIGRRPDASAAGYRYLKAVNKSVVRLSDELQAAYETSRKLYEDDAFASEPTLQQDVVGLRQQLEHIAGDIENVLQYMEHMSFLLGHKSPNS